MSGIAQSSQITDSEGNVWARGKVAVGRLLATRSANDNAFHERGAIIGVEERASGHPLAVTENGRFGQQNLWTREK